jgi:prepilin-type N-terminal cleavage/methylation domain-containing protein
MGYRRRLQAESVISKSRRRRQRGFTLAETLVVIVLGAVVAAALYQVLVFQQRFYSTERRAIARQDALRLASSVLTAELMEASSPGGDFGPLETDSLSLRSPVGFAIVCAVDSPSALLGLFNVTGRVSASDSLLIYHPDGWLVRGVQAPPSETGVLSCPYTGGPTIEQVVRVAGSITGVPVGAPVRAFHRYTYRLEQEGSRWWLARSDGNVTDLLAGPFSGDGSGLSFTYLDSLGQSTTNPTRVARVDLALVAVSAGAQSETDTLTATIRPRNP